jgi:hypothetical protein
VPGAHALNYSDPQLIAELIRAHIDGEPLTTATGRRSVVEHVRVDAADQVRDDENLSRARDQQDQPDSQ